MGEEPEALLSELASGAPHRVWVVTPGFSPEWAARHLDLSRDKYFGGFLGITGEAGLSPSVIEEALREEAALVLAGAPDSTARALPPMREAAGGDPEGLILCGLEEDAPSTPSHCLWISAHLREPKNLEPGPDWVGHVLPARMAREIRHVGGISRDLRLGEINEILALSRSRLEAFRSLPTDLPAHPMARLKRVFLGDKLFANATLYAMSSCRWTGIALRLGLAEAFRGAMDAVEDEWDESDPDAEEIVRGLRRSGSLIADRMDRVLHSLWNEIPEGGVLHLVAGDADSTYVFARRKGEVREPR
jgi:hypothetical protein